jgi:hypothetical protein
MFAGFWSPPPMSHTMPCAKVQGDTGPSTYSAHAECTRVCSRTQCCPGPRGCPSPLSSLGLAAAGHCNLDTRKVRCTGAPTTAAA